MSNDQLNRRLAKNHGTMLLDSELFVQSNATKRVAVQLFSYKLFSHEKCDHYFILHYFFTFLWDTKPLSEKVEEADIDEHEPFKAGNVFTFVQVIL